VTSQRILVVGGLLLLLLSAGYGVLYDGIIMEERYQEMRYNLDMALNKAVQGDPVLAGRFAKQFVANSEQKDRQARVQQFLVLAGAAAGLALWLAPKLTIRESVKRIFALLIVGGGGLLALGGLLRAWEGNDWTFYLVIGGYAWILLGLVGYLLYSLLYIWLNDEIKSKKE